MTYTVEISKVAWSQLGVVPRRTFQEIREGLDALAAGLNSGQADVCPESTGELVTRSLIVDGYAGLYTVDAQQQVITLVEVTRRLGAADWQP